ncbi:hypothetical protein BDV93DRAFT_562676 [Ceratobasidium sp. AG-I]|nr:hypothetical protein BDV93DRAFT_562676 [Ceratobasidium sp. AG-I]
MPPSQQVPFQNMTLWSLSHNTDQNSPAQAEIDWNYWVPIQPPILFAWRNAQANITVYGIESITFNDRYTSLPTTQGITVVDLRNATEYNAHSIAGAINVEFDALNPQLFSAGLNPYLNHMYQENLVVFHCEFGQHRTPRGASEYLRLWNAEIQAGNPNVNHGQLVCMLQGGIKPIIKAAEAHKPVLEGAINKGCGTFSCGP